MAGDAEGAGLGIPLLASALRPSSELLRGLMISVLCISLKDSDRNGLSNALRRGEVVHPPEKAGTEVWEIHREGRREIPCQPVFTFSPEQAFKQV